jgi:hypothetical protein
LTIPPITGLVVVRGIAEKPAGDEAAIVEVAAHVDETVLVLVEQSPPGRMEGNRVRGGASHRRPRMRRSAAAALLPISVLAKATPNRHAAVSKLRPHQASEA